MINETDVNNALKTIIDPDFNKDIVSLGFVQNIKIEGSHISLDLALTTPACPVKETFKKSAEDNLLKLKGITKVSVNMTVLPQKAMPQNAAPTQTLKNVRSIIAISSCKGGVGKSTVAGYFAMELARRGYKVGLVDCDIHGPSIPTLFNLNKVDLYQNEHKQLIPVEKNNLKLMSFGFLLGDAPAVMRGPIVTRYVQQLLVGTDWGELDYLFIDMPPGTGDVQLTITQMLRLNGAVIVTTPQTLSLVDVSRGILMFERVNVPILGLIENMSYFICDNCDKKHYIFGNHQTQSLTKRFGLETIAELPILPQFIQKIDEPIANEFIMSAVDKLIRAVGKQSISESQIPKIEFDQNEITLTFEGQKPISISNHDLRANCQCALCINELTGEAILKGSDVNKDIAAKEVFPLGNYALGIIWNDGHSSGIYPYNLIRNLAENKSLK